MSWKSIVHNLCVHNQGFHINAGGMDDEFIFYFLFV